MFLNKNKSQAQKNYKIQSKENRMTLRKSKTETQLNSFFFFSARTLFIYYLFDFMLTNCICLLVLILGFSNRESLLGLAGKSFIVCMCTFLEFFFFGCNSFEKLICIVIKIERIYINYFLNVWQS